MMSSVAAGPCPTSLSRSRREASCSTTPKKTKKMVSRRCWLAWCARSAPAEVMPPVALRKRSTARLRFPAADCVPSFFAFIFLRGHFTRGALFVDVALPRGRIVCSLLAPPDTVYCFTAFYCRRGVRFFRWGLQCVFAVRDLTKEVSGYSSAVWAAVETGMWRFYSDCYQRSVLGIRRDCY